MDENSDLEIRLGSAERIEILIQFKEDFKLCLGKNPISHDKTREKPTVLSELAYRVIHKSVDPSDTDYPHPPHGSFNPGNLDFS